MAETRSPSPLSDAGAELSSILDSIPAPLFLTTRDGRCAWVNAAFREDYGQVFGAAAEGLLGKTMRELAQSPEAGVEALTAHERVLTTGAPHSYVTSYVFPDGTLHRLLMRKAPYRALGSAEITGVVTVVLDVTELDEAQQALADSEHQYRDLVENTSALIVRLDREGRITFCNSSTESFFGYPMAELIGEEGLGLFVPSARHGERNLAEAIAAIREDPEPYRQVEGEHETQDGRHVWVSWTVTPLYDSRGEFAGVQTVGHDITDRRRTDERLRILEAAVEGAPDAMSIAALDGRILWVNRAYLDFWGLSSADEAVGRNAREFMASPDAEAVLDTVRAGGWQGEWATQRRDGTDLVLHVAATVVQDETGRPLCMVAALKDITRRTAAEKELARFKTISDTASYGNVIVDGTTRIRYCNEAFARMHQYAVPELLGQPIRIVQSEQQLSYLRQMVEELRREGKVAAREVFGRRKDGTHFPGLLSISRIPGTDADGPLWAASIVDISDLHEIMAQLAEQKERLAVTLRSIADAVIATDAEARVSLMNPVAEALTGWREDQAWGRPVGEVLQTTVTEGPQPPCLIQSVLRTGAAAEADPRLVLVARTGAERRIAGAAAPMHDTAGQLHGVVVAFRDITEQEHMRQEAYQTHRLESLGVLAGGIAHDFNNLLTSILGGISLGRVETSLPPEALAGLQTAEKAALHARYLSQQLLTFSRGGEPVKRPLWLEEVVRGSTDMTLSGTRCTAEISLPDDLWPVEGDPAQLTQGLSNILLNAVQAMPTGGIVRLEGRNVVLGPEEHAGLAPGRYVRLSVTDQGPGIDPKVLPRIFDPYFTTKPSGSGLGLTIAYSVVSRHQGHLAIAGRPGEGATVTIHLPASSGVPEPAECPPEHAVTGTGRILVMDDDPYVRKVVGPMLRHLGYEADIVANAEAAVARVAAAIAEGRPHLAGLLDLTIKGGEGGAEVLQRLREVSPGFRALACSGYHDDPVMAHFADCGFDGVLTKPYQVRELGLAVAGLLGQSGSQGSTVG